MAYSDLDLANKALGLLGNRAITSLNPAVDTSKEARLCALWLDTAKQAVLRLHLWNFAIKRSPLITQVTKAVTGAVADAGGTLVSVAAHGFVVGDLVSITGVVGTTEINGRWRVTSVPGAGTFVVAVTFVNAYVSGGISWKSPSDELPYSLVLPTDFIRLVSLSDDDVDYALEDKTLSSDVASVIVRYIYDVTDYTKFDPLFYNVLAYYLAWTLAYSITGSNSVKDTLANDIRTLLPKSKVVDAQENKSGSLDATEWTDAHGDRSRFPRDPMT